MIDKTIRDALFIEIHKSAEKASSWVAETFGTKDPLYPLEGELLPEERSALANIHLSPEAKSGLKKLVASAVITPVFDLFNLIDGVADPSTGRFDPWLGLTLAPKPEEDEPMLHDELYESYWLYKKYEKKRS